MTKWISVKDELPEYSKPVFLDKEDGQIYIGVRDKTDIEGESYIMFKHPTHPQNTNKIKYWMYVNIPEIS